jgi:hypothetical protein
MRILNRKPRFAAALGRYARARRAQDENQIAEQQAGTDYETPEFLRINRETWEAELAIPLWLRWTVPLIDLHVEIGIDFWHRMDQS